MRIFYICSYGGCASTMICNFLSQFYKVYHIHSRFPPARLCSVRKTKRAKKYEWFKYGTLLNRKQRSMVTVIYLYRKPSMSLLSKDGWGPTHFSNLSLNNKKMRRFHSKDNSVRLEYSKTEKDLLGLNNFFKNYVFRNINKNYRIHCIKYETLWENLELIFNKLKIPKEICDKFPKKYVKELDDEKKEIKENLEKKYSKMEKCMDLLPPYFLIKPRR